MYNCKKGVKYDSRAVSFAVHSRIHSFRTNFCVWCTMLPHVWQYGPAGLIEFPTENFHNAPALPFFLPSTRLTAPPPSSCHFSRSFLIAPSFQLTRRKEREKRIGNVFVWLNYYLWREKCDNKSSKRHKHDTQRIKTHLAIQLCPLYPPMTFFKRGLIHSLRGLSALLLVSKTRFILSPEWKTKEIKSIKRWRNNSIGLLTSCDVNKTPSDTSDQSQRPW